jgi:exodeoxyribonuclease VII small subunit
MSEPVDTSGSARVDQDIDGLSYEAARDALIAVVDELERGGATLEQSLALWERGEALATRCETWLTGARARLDATRTDS